MRAAATEQLWASISDLIFLSRFSLCAEQRPPSSGRPRGWTWTRRPWSQEGESRAFSKPGCGVAAFPSPGTVRGQRSVTPTLRETQLAIYFKEVLFLERLLAT